MWYAGTLIRAYYAESRWEGTNVPPHNISRNCGSKYELLPALVAAGCCLFDGQTESRRITPLIGILNT